MKLNHYRILRLVQPLEKINALPLLGELHAKLIELLRGLSPEQWNSPTVCPAWKVRDIAAHLLDTDLRRLSFCRDRLRPPAPGSPITGYGDLVRFLNELNADWIRVAQRLSFQVLVDLQSVVGPQVNDFWMALDPDEPAEFPVSWAGETVSANWFDCAREYTERWHHQQQIREAVGAAGLTSRHWLHPVLATFVRALPAGYRDVEALPGATVTFAIDGEAGGVWTLRRNRNEWELLAGSPSTPTATVKTDQDVAWRIFTKGIARETASKRTTILGVESLGTPFLKTLAIMA